MLFVVTLVLLGIIFGFYGIMLSPWGDRWLMKQLCTGEQAGTYRQFLVHVSQLKETVSFELCS